MKTSCIILLLISTNTFAQFGEQEHVKHSSFDTLHIYPSKYLQSSGIPTSNSGLFKGEIVPKTLIEEYGLHSYYPADKYTTPASFLIDPRSFTTAYVLTCENNGSIENSCIVIVVFNKDWELIYHQVIASFEEIAGTMKEMVNTWLFDEDQDGDMDFVTVRDLVDYELPNELADNISGVDALFYRFEKDSITTEYLSKKLFYTFKVIQ